MRALPMHAVGRSAPYPLVAAGFAVSFAGWLAAGAALVPGSASLAVARIGSRDVVLAIHLAGLVFLPFAVVAAAWHLLPIMFRSDLPSLPHLWVSLALLAGGAPLAAGVAADLVPLVWIGSGLVAGGLAIAASELVGLVRRVPPGKALVTSRVGVVLSLLHLLAAFALGAATAESGGPRVLGVAYERLILVHLVLAGLGWLTLLILAVGRPLVPMLAQAPAPGPRRLPTSEILFAAGLWCLLAGLAAAVVPLVWLGAAVLVLVLARFAVQVAGVVRHRKMGAIEGPLAHVVAGGILLAEAAGIGLAGLTGAFDERRAAIVFAMFLVVGWAAGVTVGHAGKLLSLSAWASWPPGPRPKQRDFYPRRLWAAESVAFAIGVQLLGIAILTSEEATARAGAAAVLLAAVLACAGAAATERSRRRLRGLTPSDS